MPSRTSNFSEIAREIQDLQRAAASVKRTRELFLVESKIKSRNDCAIPEGALEVEFQNVSFAYREEAVIKNASFKLEAGKVLGLLGRTGSGKTTVARLLFRLYDPEAGEIRLAQRSIQQADLNILRSRVGLVTQNVQLFHASLRDNLTLFDESIGNARIMETIDDLDLSKWYAQLPEGLDSILASDGSDLSAGEAQLLAFARVFILKEPGLIILDEASSRLDPSTERLIENAVEKLIKNRTAVIIAHRLETIQRAESIMILEEGKIAEYGQRRLLMEDPRSRFNQLLRTGMEDVLA